MVVHRAFALGLLCVWLGLGCQAGSGEPEPSAPAERSVGSPLTSGFTSFHGVVFSASGPIAGMHCLRIAATFDPHGWDDNYLCSPTDLGFFWYDGDTTFPWPDLRCIEMTERGDPALWFDKRLCVPHDSPLTMTWSSTGPLPGKECIRFHEPEDPYGWSDNYLCLEAPLVMAFSASGPIAGMSCTSMNEPADAAGGWTDNHLCTNKDIGLRWSINGELPGMRCTQIHESAEPAYNAWHDNYLCVPPEAEAMFSYSSAGPLPGRLCTQLLEADDPYTWDDNYLCYHEVPVNLEFSSAGQMPGKVCTALTETSDVAGTWLDNYLCAQRDVGIRWSLGGPISGMRCTRIWMNGEGVATGWNDNYLCLPPTSALNFVWSPMGRCANKISVPFDESADPHAHWMDSYLCY
ncbi:hypothetical protein OWM54_05395 [Myxococcus sp. MISCRS1]|uniref:hypothetical protein n=1 Tax=Myxococcus sp. MISCRS1 TaxID=2996786 RepID=UPI00226EC34C|nr:hypothetical protein [Myxococcus sp. MISCRS1]MCY0996566.1 hypothetical protein [Myxococcus sp. MISCRS1]